MIQINDNLLINSQDLRAAEARKLNKNYLITLTFTDGKQVNFNVDTEQQKNEAMAILNDGDSPIKALKRQTKSK